MRRIPLLCCLYCALAILAAPAAGGDPGSEPRSQNAVLLRNGNVLLGAATRLGDRILIQPDRGSELRIPEAEVELIAADLVELYRYKRNRLPPAQSAAQLDLADWCIRQGLYSQAASQLVEVMRYDPTNPRLALVETRLRAAAAPPSSPSSSGSPAEPSAAAKPSGSSAIGQTGRGAASPSLEQLEQEMRSLPAGVVQHFTAKIEPLLVARCSASGCHGSTSSSLKLLRLGSDTSLARRFSQRNLHSALQYLDREHPESSPLLTAPAHPHGTAQTAIFSENEQAAYKELAAWVQEVCRPNAAGDPLASKDRSARTAGDPSSFDAVGLASKPRNKPPAVKDFLDRESTARRQSPRQRTPVGETAAPRSGGISTSAGLIPASGRPSTAAALTPSASADTDKKRLPPIAAEDRTASDPDSPADPFDPAAFNQER